MLVCKGDWSGPGSVGCVAGDAQSYILFCDFFDRIIEAHHEQKITTQTPESDFNYDNLKVAGQTCWLFTRVVVNKKTPKTRRQCGNAQLLKLNHPGMSP